MTPRIALLVIGDGRDALKQDTMRSWNEHAHEHELATIVDVDDRYHALGFCGAIRYGWARLRDEHPKAGFDYVFHLEEDWSFVRDFSILDMADVLDTDPTLAQIALRRGAENDVERAAGGLVEVWPSEYRDATLFVGGVHPVPDPPGGRRSVAIDYLVHRLFFTTNPSLYPYDLLGEFDWPEAPRCEEAFGLTLTAEGRAFAFLGSRDSGAWVEHTGRHQRRGTGY